MLRVASASAAISDCLFRITGHPEVIHTPAKSTNRKLTTTPQTSPLACVCWLDGIIWSKGYVGSFKTERRMKTKRAPNAELILALSLFILWGPCWKYGKNVPPLELRAIYG